MGDRYTRNGTLLSIDRHEIKDRETGEVSYYTKYAIGFEIMQDQNHVGLDIQEFTGSDKLFDVLKDYFNQAANYVIELVDVYDRESKKRIPKKKIVQVDDVELA